jgi:hypothetical protein
VKHPLGERKFIVICVAPYRLFRRRRDFFLVPRPSFLKDHSDDLIQRREFEKGYRRLTFVANLRCSFFFAPGSAPTLMRADLVRAGSHTSPLRASSSRLPSGAVGRFEEASEGMQDLAFARVGLPLVFGDGHALFQPADRVVPGRGQRLAQFLTNRAELF